MDRQKIKRIELQRTYCLSRRYKTELGPSKHVVLGHRNLNPKSLPLRKGMLRYSYARKMPCQIVMTKNKELPLSEKTWTVRYGTPIFVSYSELIRPTDYDNFDDFLEAVQKMWDEKWETVFSINDPKGNSQSFFLRCF